MSMFSPSHASASPRQAFASSSVALGHDDEDALRAEHLGHRRRGLGEVEAAEDVELRVHVDAHGIRHVEPVVCGADAGLHRHDAALGLAARTGHDDRHVDGERVVRLHLPEGDAQLAFVVGRDVQLEFRGPRASDPLLEVRGEVRFGRALERLPDVVPRRRTEAVRTIETLQRPGEELVTEAHAQHVEHEQALAVPDGLRGARVAALELGQRGRRARR